MTDRLFDPGPTQPSRWKNHPNQWVKNPLVVYHATESVALPRQDRGPHLDPGYGGSSGIHMGTKQAAMDRAALALRGPNAQIHTARIASPIAKPSSDSNTFSDREANYGHEAETHVREGRAVPYTNTYEDAGSTSYRVKPESLRTWSEDIANDPNAHPALKHLASRGYNPSISVAEAGDTVTKKHDESRLGPAQKQLWDAALMKGGKEVEYGNEDELFAKHVADSSGLTGVKRLNKVQFFSRANEVANITPRLRPRGAQ